MRPVKARAGNFAKHSGESTAAARVLGHDDLRARATAPIAALLLRLRRSKGRGNDHPDCDPCRRGGEDQLPHDDSPIKKGHPLY
jgi:hypothetical protein